MTKVRGSHEHAPVCMDDEAVLHDWPDSDALLFKGVAVGLPIAGLLWVGLFWLAGLL